MHGSTRELARARVAGEVLDRLLRLRTAGEPRREIERAARLGATILVAGDAAYPTEWNGHPDAPLVIYLRGRDVAFARRAAIIGSRDASVSMERFAAHLGEACARAGVPVVSGLARGIDAAAHEGCLTGRGVPIGVLGTGIDRVYPRQNVRLHAAVAEHGTLLTTYPLGTEPYAHHFPLRNRLVAALAHLVVVVQATEDSGTMSTARAALDSGTEIGAVPGSPDDPLARGTNRLIRDGARPILEAADLLDPLVGVGVVPAEPFTRGDDRTQEDADPILRQIGSKPLAPEEIALAIGRPLHEVHERLLRLEIDGRVERRPGRLYGIRVVRR